MLEHYVHKSLDRSLRLQILGQNPEYLPGYTFKLFGKNLNYGSTLVVNINIVVNCYFCTRKYFNKVKLKKQLALFTLLLSSVAFHLGGRVPWPSWLRLYQPLNQQTIDLPVCSWLNNCKFVITPAMKFSIAKLQKNISKTYQKKLKGKTTEKQQQRIKLNQGEKSKYKSL